MSSDELLQAMWDVYTKTHPRDDRMIAMRAVLDVLHKAGYRRCAEVEKTEALAKALCECGEYWRARAEKAEAELHEIASVLPGIAYMDPPDGGSPSMPEQFRRMRADLDRTAAEVERLRERNDEWERKASAWMASPEAVQQLDGYRELAQKLNAAAAEVERLEKDNAGWQDGYSALTAEVERLRADAEQWKQAVKARRVLPVGSYYGPDDHVPERDATAHGIAIDAARGEHEQG